MQRVQARALSSLSKCFQPAFWLTSAMRTFKTRFKLVKSRFYKFIRPWPWTAARSKNRAVASRGSSRLSPRRKSKELICLAGYTWVEGLHQLAVRLERRDWTSRVHKSWSVDHKVRYAMTVKFYEKTETLHWDTIALALETSLRKFRGNTDVIWRQLFLVHYVCLHLMTSSLVPIVIWYIDEL